MGDPTFETRAELAAWASGQAKRAGATWPHSKVSMLRVLDQIKRVTLAHVHLPFDDASPVRKETP